MKKLLLAAIVSLSTISTAALAEVKVGIILGFTGPIETLTPAMRDSAKLAFKEASDSGALLDGETVKVLIGDSTCVDSDAAVAAAEIIVPQGITLTVIGILTVQVNIQNFGTINVVAGVIEDGATIENKTNPDNSQGQILFGEIQD